MEQLTLWSEDLPANPSPSQEDERAFAESLASCSNIYELLRRLNLDTCSGRTSADVFQLGMTHSGSSSRTYRNSGIALRGRVLMLNSSVWRSGASVSFLSDVLEAWGGEPAAVLFESESVRGNTVTSREKRAQLARASRKRAPLGGGDVERHMLPANATGGQKRQAVLCIETGQAAAASAPNDNVAPALNCNHEQPILVIGSDSSRASCEVDLVPTLHVGGRCRW